MKVLVSSEKQTKLISFFFDFDIPSFGFIKLENIILITKGFWIIY